LVAAFLAFINLGVKHMKKLTVAILAILPTIATALDMPETDLKALSLLPESQATSNNSATLKSGLQDTLGAIRHNSGSAGVQPKSLNTDPSKIEALKGTYSLSYSIATSRYTDKIVIDQVYTDTDGEIMGKGLYYSNQTGSGELVYCTYDPVLWGSLDADYMCLTGNIVYQTFAFRFSGNTITGGYYGIGFDAESAATSLMSKNKPITGIRAAAGSTSTPTPTTTKDEYVPLTGKLTLPNVKVGAENYSAILIYEGNNLFRLQSATKK
jgi:hypothetical protein